MASVFEKINSVIKRIDLFGQREYFFLEVIGVVLLLDYFLLFFLETVLPGFVLIFLNIKFLFFLALLALFLAKRPEKENISEKKYRFLPYALKLVVFVFFVALLLQFLGIGILESAIYFVFIFAIMKILIEVLKSDTRNP